MMAFPRILIAVPLIVAGAFIPAAGAAPAKAPTGAVGMEHEDFAVKEIKIHRGETVTFTNDSRYMHIIGPGHDGELAGADGGPVQGRVLMPSNENYTTPPFDVPGTYHITCPMHPEMTIAVIVTD